MKLLQRIGIIGFWLAWPAFYIYLGRSVRTRVIVSQQERVLVLKNWLSDGRWSLPGGGLHAGEDVSIGAARELFEETGIQVAPADLKQLGGGQYRLHGLRYTFKTLLVELPTAPPLRRQQVEVSAMAWLSPRELSRQGTSPDVFDSLALLEK